MVLGLVVLAKSSLAVSVLSELCVFLSPCKWTVPSAPGALPSLRETRPAETSLLAGRSGPPLPSMDLVREEATSQYCSTRLGVAARAPHWASPGRPDSVPTAPSPAIWQPRERRGGAGSVR